MGRARQARPPGLPPGPGLEPPPRAVRRARRPQLLLLEDLDLDRARGESAAQARLRQGTARRRRVHRGPAGPRRARAHVGPLRAPGRGVRRAVRPGPRTAPAAGDLDDGDRLLSSLPASGGGAFRVVIHPGNFDRFSFRWPEEKFAELADSLLDDARLKLFFMGGPGERAKVEAITAKLKRPVPILPEARLGVTGAMLKRMNLFVCNITGTTHLAAALGVPTFGFYAGYTQAVWRPRGARHGGVVCPEWESCRETTVEEARAALLEHVRRLSPY
ncbi:MAG: hypothetical protein M0D55_12725 [Elusimicrobiota bacterium]|nr:MAG: hypothetical protein M0D55_12725 [Elusimicrobiota bacterium]